MILSAMLFLLAVICYSIKELHSFGKLKWMSMNNLYSFTGEWSYLRKYKRGHDASGVIKYLRIEAPKTWYYKMIGSKYVEAWPTSTWLTVSLTDLFHLMQFFFKLLFCAAFYPLTNWWFPFILWLLWTIVWNLCDKYLTK